LLVGGSKGLTIVEARRYLESNQQIGMVVAAVSD
jgi:hypothetical protein